MTERMEKRAKEILRRPYARVLTPDESGGYSAEILEFRGCLSEGDSIEQAHANLEEAAHNWVKACLEQGLPIPPPYSVKTHSGKVALRMPRSLHRQLTVLAQHEGVSLNQLIVSTLSARIGSEGHRRTDCPEISARRTAHSEERS